MATAEIIGMNRGEGENSYAKNSDFQGFVQEMMMPLVEASVAELCRAGVPSRVAFADLGCSSGPNALALVCKVCKHVHGMCLHKCAERDDDGNGKAQPTLVFVFGAPGSFYGRLFPAGTLHLACSSCTLHWLSKVPEELQSRKLINKNICAGRTSPPEVISAYARQFKSDFTSFLESRAEETVPGGWLVFSIKGRSHKNMADTEDCRCWDDMAAVLYDMASRGVIDEEKVESSQLPVYEPSLEEMREANEAEGSFEAVRLERHEIVESEGAADVARGMRRGDDAPARGDDAPALRRRRGGGDDGRVRADGGGVL